MDLHEDLVPSYYPLVTLLPQSVRHNVISVLLDFTVFDVTRENPPDYSDISPTRPRTLPFSTISTYYTIFLTETP